MRGAWGLGLLALAGLAMAAPPDGKKIQCWTDDKGQRMCGDTIPPQYVGEQREVIKEGRVVETVRPAKTAEERAQEERRAAAEAAAQKQIEYDRSLLQTYRSTADLEAMRKERLEFIDGRIHAVEKSIADNEKALADLRGRAEQQQKDKGKVDERLAKQVRQFERSLQRNQRSLENLNREREATKTKFDSDIARFRELKGGPEAAPKPQPAG